MTIRDVFRDKGTFGTTLLIAVIDAYGTECIEWDPEALRKEILDDYQVDLSASTMDRIMAAMSVLASDMFFVSLEAFNNTCEALNFGPVDGDRFIPCELDDIMWGCTEVRLLLGSQEYDEADWSHDVRRYTAAQLSMEGVTKAPDILTFAEFDSEELDNKDTLLATDQLMASTYQGRQQTVLKELNDEAIGNLQQLLRQVASLKLEHGKTDQVQKLLDDIMAKISESGQPEQQQI